MMATITVAKAASLANVTTRQLGWMLPYLGFESLGQGNPGKRGIDNKVPIEWLPRIFIMCQLRCSGVTLEAAGGVAMAATIDEYGNWNGTRGCVIFRGCVTNAHEVDDLDLLGA